MTYSKMNPQGVLLLGEAYFLRPIPWSLLQSALCCVWLSHSPQAHAFQMHAYLPGSVQGTPCALKRTCNYSPKPHARPRVFLFSKGTKLHKTEWSLTQNILKSKQSTPPKLWKVLLLYKTDFQHRVQCFSINRKKVFNVLNNCPIWYGRKPKQSDPQADHSYNRVLRSLQLPFVFEFSRFLNVPKPYLWELESECNHEVVSSIKASSFNTEHSEEDNTRSLPWVQNRDCCLIPFTCHYCSDRAS